MCVNLSLGDLNPQPLLPQPTSTYTCELTIAIRVHDDTKLVSFESLPWVHLYSKMLKCLAKCIMFFYMSPNLLSPFHVSLYIPQIKSCHMSTYLIKLVIFCISLFQLLKINIKKIKKKLKKKIQDPTTDPHCYRHRFTNTNPHWRN